MDANNRKIGARNVPKELKTAINDWLREYEYYQKNPEHDAIINPYLAGKYKLIRRTLRQDFMKNGDELSRNIKSLPNIWFYRNANIVVILGLVCLTAFIIIQIFFLKLETGIEVLSSPRSGRNIDLIEVLLYWPLDILILILIIRRWAKKLDNVINTLSKVNALL